MFSKDDETRDRMVLRATARQKSTPLISEIMKNFGMRTKLIITVLGPYSIFLYRRETIAAS